MGMFKEYAHFLERLEGQQEQIWPDSADSGIVLGPKETDMMRETVEVLLELPGSSVVWKAAKPVVQRTYELLIMWGGRGVGMYDATMFTVGYWDGKGKKFFTIDSRHVVCDDKGKVM